MALYGPRRAAARLEPAGGRWPAHEAADRLALGAGLAALGAFGLSAARWEPYRALLSGLAARLAAAGDGPLPGDLVPLDRMGVPGPLAVVPWQGAGTAGVAVELLGTPAGAVPRAAGERGGAGVRQACALALLVALAADADGAGRLEIALALEGLLGWYRESDRLTAPRQALAFALAHAAQRLREAGRAAPPGL